MSVHPAVYERRSENKLITTSIALASQQIRLLRQKINVEGNLVTKLDI